MRIRPPALAFAVVSLVACSGTDSADAISIQSAEMVCDKQKIDVAGPVRAACSGKTSCRCDEACWSNGAYPTGCVRVGFNLSYRAAGKAHGVSVSDVNKGQFLVITEDGKATFE